MDSSETLAAGMKAILEAKQAGRLKNAPAIIEAVEADLAHAQWLKAVEKVVAEMRYLVRRTDLERMDQRQRIESAAQRIAKGER